MISNIFLFISLLWFFLFLFSSIGLIAMVWNSSLPSKQEEFKFGELCYRFMGMFPVYVFGNETAGKQTNVLTMSITFLTLNQLFLAFYLNSL